MDSISQALAGAATLAAALVTAAGAAGIPEFKTDEAADRWLRTNSVTYARLLADITDRKDIRGYRFVTKAAVRQGMAAWVDGYLEIQLNPALAGHQRVTILVFEMANAARSADHEEVDRAADEGLLRTPEEFGLAHEMLEYEALRLHRQVLLEIEPRDGALPAEFFCLVTPAPPSAREYRLPALATYLKTQKESGHTDHYYRFFHKRTSGRATLFR